MLECATLAQKSDQPKSYYESNKVDQVKLHRYKISKTSSSTVNKALIQVELSCQCSKKHWFIGSVRNSSVSLSPILDKNDKVEQYIRIKIHKPIALKFSIKSDINTLCGSA